ncbi:hypothetical protein J421_0236 [Gemmatirosa kalamazoonensis]|uniref:Uncharacterized protein n=1 Tax=Gemmatirosa kalamazoonensis TaxID=861299 RepID=W0REH1_9BACT|nr:hypothetical protein J421_0236 [Gemmatirosa kalamazoonensis]
MWWFLVRPAHQGGAAAVLGEATVVRVAAFGLAFLVAKWWVAGANERALAFTPAEIHVLFAAPLTRRALVGAKLLRAQLIVLVNTIVWSVILRGEGMHLAAWRRALGLWVLFSVLYLHRLGAALSTASVVKHGAAGRRRQAVPIVVVALGAAALGWTLLRAAPMLDRAWSSGPTALLGALMRELEAEPARTVLSPFRALLTPALAVSAGEWLRAIGPALVLLALHALWVLRTDVAFEDAAVEASERVAARRASRARGTPGIDHDRPGDDFTTDAGTGILRRRSIPLAPTGAPAVAILWKNAVAALRAGFLLRQLGLLGALAAAALLLAMRDERIAEVALVVAGVWGGLLVIAGPMWIRFDLRQDLPNLAVLRAWPLSGREIVAAQIASSTAALTVFQLALLVGLLAVSFLGRIVPMSASDRLALAAAAALALPGVNAAGLTVQNGAALLFPGWVRLGAGARGVEAMGQSILSVAASFAILCLLLALPAALATGVVWALRGTWSIWTFAPAALLGTVAVAAELLPLLSWLGRVFERTETIN